MLKIFNRSYLMLFLLPILATSLTACFDANVEVTSNAVVAEEEGGGEEEDSGPSTTAAIDGSWGQCLAAEASMFGNDTLLQTTIDDGEMVVVVRVYDSQGGTCDGTQEIYYHHEMTIELADLLEGQSILDHHSNSLLEEDGAYAVNIVSLSQSISITGNPETDEVAALYVSLFQDAFSVTLAQNEEYHDLQLDESSLGIGEGVFYTILYISPESGNYMGRGPGGSTEEHNGLTAETRMGDIETDEEQLMPSL